jgi:hypothetical protein
MASSTAPGEICHVPSPTDGIVVLVFRTKDLAIYAPPKNKMTWLWAENEKIKYRNQKLLLQCRSLARRTIICKLQAKQEIVACAPVLAQSWKKTLL